MTAKFKRCADCIHSTRLGVESPRFMCHHPDVKLFTDDIMHKNSTVWSDAARDIKLMCGHDARWFKSRSMAFQVDN